MDNLSGTSPVGLERCNESNEVIDGRYTNPSRPTWTPSFDTCSRCVTTAAYHFDIVFNYTSMQLWYVKHMA